MEQLLHRYWLFGYICLLVVNIHHPESLRNAFNLQIIDICWTCISAFPNWCVESENAQMYVITGSCSNTHSPSLICSVMHLCCPPYHYSNMQQLLLRAGWQPLTRGCRGDRSSPGSISLFGLTGNMPHQRTYTLEMSHEEVPSAPTRLHVIHMLPRIHTAWSITVSEQVLHY